MTDSLRNTRTHIPDDLYRELAHLAVDLPGATVGSLLVEGARLLIEKYGRGRRSRERS
jgi:hypothetical protein